MTAQGAKHQRLADLPGVTPGRGLLDGWNQLFIDQLWNLRLTRNAGSFLPASVPRPPSIRGRDDADVLDCLHYSLRKDSHQ